MPHILTRSRENPEFARVVEVARLAAGNDFEFDVSPEPDEAAALARLLGLVSIKGLRFSGRLGPLDAGWDLEGVLVARVVQTCVITLDPLISQIEQTVRRRFLPGTAAAEIEVSPEDDDEIEPLRDRIDLGLVATEALALTLPDYPRKPGAQLEGDRPDDAPADGDNARPFAALAALRERMGGGS